MMKHTLIRNTLVLCVAGLGLGSCKKEVTQRVDQAFSATYTLTPANWQSDGSGGFYTNIPVPEVDPVIVSSGGVLVYLSFDGGTTFEALPEVLANVAYGTYHSDKTVSIDLTSADGTGVVTSPPSKNLIAKLVVIDATPLD